MGERRPEDQKLTPEEAFSTLADPIRIQILQALGTEGRPLSFTELYERTDADNSAQFNYHLEKVVGSFIEKTDSGYTLRQPGRRVVEAVLSGAVTAEPVLDRRPIEWECHFCGQSPIELEYREEQVGVYCTACEGMYGGVAESEAGVPPAERNRLHYMHLPPAGVVDRSPEEVYLTASRWTNAETVTAGFGICPRCSARLDQSVVVCENHEPGEALCPDCDRRYATLYRTTCTNCVYDAELIMVNKLLTNLDLRAFLIEHGMNPLYPQSATFGRTFIGHEEDVRSVDPLEVRFTFTVDDDAITLTVDDSLDVVDVQRRTGADS